MQTQHRADRRWIIVWTLLLTAILLLWSTTTFQSIHSSTKIDHYHDLWDHLESFALLMSALILISYLLQSKKSAKAFLFPSLLTMICLFGFGEESNWGQNFFHFDTPEFFKSFNAKEQLNIHHLEVYGVNFNTYKNILLPLFIFTYTLLLPLLSHFSPRVKQFFNDYCIPIPPLVFGVFIIAGLVVAGAYRFLYFRMLPESLVWINLGELNEALVSFIILGSVAINVRKWRISLLKQ